MLDFFPMPRLQRVILVIVLLCALPPAGVSAQDQGVAVITSPLDGAIVSGVVPISGAATHPQFQRYELAFGYSPDPTDTWFSLQDPAGPHGGAQRPRAAVTTRVAAGSWGGNQ